MTSKTLKIILCGAACLTISLSAISKHVKIYRVPETGRTILLDDEKVYRIKTSLGRQGEFRYVVNEDAFINPHSKRKLELEDGEWIADFSTIEGIKPGGNIVGFVTWPIRQGTTIFGYPFDEGDVYHNISSNLLAVAVDGDRVMYQSHGTNYSFVAVYSAYNNTLKWHKPESFEVCHVFPIPDADKFFYYTRMQNVGTNVVFGGGRKLKSGNVIYFRDHGIDETYRIAEQYGFERTVDFSANLLGGKLTLKSDTTKLSVLNPRKFYVVLKSGHKAFGMFQPSVENYKVIFSPITAAPLSVSESDIVGFEPIGDGAFPQSECYTKNEVDTLYERYMMEPEVQPEDGFIIRTLHHLTGEFWNREHPARSVLWMVLFLGIIWLCKYMYKVRRRIWEWLLSWKRR